MAGRRTRGANLGGPTSRWYVPWDALRRVVEAIERADAGAGAPREPEYLRRIREAAEEARNGEEES